jgi:predicted acylesterase/phospholipase RssA
MSEIFSHTHSADTSTPSNLSPFAPAADDTSPFDAVVFAGGGCRCFWQAGFWEEAAPALGLRPRIVASVSAGAAFACSALSGTSHRVLEGFKRRAAANRRNFYPRSVLRGEPAFPHERIYRGLILENIDEAVLSKLQSGPELQMLLARPIRPLSRSTRLSSAAMLSVAITTHVLNRRERLVHARWGERFGFQPEMVSVRSCANASELAELILHTSCAPPLLPLYRRDDRSVLDGGLIDNAPADFVAPARSTLVLLSFPYESWKIPKIPGRMYVQPSEEVPVAEWDYTSPERVQATFDLGRRDGEAFARAHAGQAAPTATAR